MEVRELLNETANKSPAPAIPRALSTLAVVDALLGKNEIAIAEAKRAVAMVPISKDAMVGPALLINLAVVYAWIGESDLAIQTLTPLAKIPWGYLLWSVKARPLLGTAAQRSALREIGSRASAEGLTRLRRDGE
jgi:hypothetical protein